MAVYELRVHGVGGSPGPRLLGFESSTDVLVVGEGVAGTEVLARRTDPGVEGYNWGDLTSGKGTRALWILLLPFTLLNVAGWMHPPVSRTSQRQVTWIRRWVQILSVLLTATYVFSFGIILVDVAGWQWSRRLALSKQQSAEPLGNSTLFIQRIGVVVGLVVLAAVSVVLVLLARMSQKRFEQTEPSRKVIGNRDGDEPWGPNERLCDPGFFYHTRAAGRGLWAHGAVMGLTFAMVAGLSIYRMVHVGPTPPKTLEVGNLLGPCSAVAIVVILLLYLFSLRTGRHPGERWVRCAPAIAATLSFALVNATFSGAILLLVKRLNDWPKRMTPLPLHLTPGPEANLVDVWGGLILVLVAVVVALLVAAGLRRPASDVDLRHSGPGRLLDGADSSYRKSIAKSRFLADWAHKGGGVALAVAVTLIVTDVVFVLNRAECSPHFPYLPVLPAYPLRPAGGIDGLLYRVGTYVLPLLILTLIQLVRKSTKGARTFASTLWDVLTFWPRRFSPLAVRPYSERAVPELQGRTVYHIHEQGRAVVLSAHSQGSILAFAALAPLSGDDLSRIGFVTYGSPITSIFATFFPAYFGTDEVDALRLGREPSGGGLMSWRNFYRATDPIGGPVFAATSGGPSGEDQRLDDPLEGSASSSSFEPLDRLADPDATAPLEQDRPVWSQLAVHSYYLQEPMLKQWVKDLTAALAQVHSP